MKSYYDAVGPIWKIKSQGANWCVVSNAVVEGPPSDDWIEVVPLSRAITAERELEAVIDAINLYGGRLLHKALDDAGLAQRGAA